MKKHLFTIATLVLLLAAIGIPIARAQSVSRVEGLHRVGPIDPSSGFPLWYQDKNGLRLSLCDNPFNCFAEINPQLPLQFPFDNPNDPNNNYADEVFYFAAEAMMVSPNNGSRTIIGMAIEGAFAGAGVINGDQVVFSRVRIRIDNLIEGEHYVVTHPYGVHDFIAGTDAGPGTQAGPGLSFVRDIGITAGKFSDLLNGDIGPFLLPTGYVPTPGTFISTGLGNTTVTGSPLATNYYRIEGPGVGLLYSSNKCADITLGPDPASFDDCAETDLFVVQGKVSDRNGVVIDRASYGKTNTNVHVNVWANSVAGQQLLARVDGGAAIQMIEGEPGNYFARIAVGALGAGVKPAEVVVTNMTDNPPIASSSPIGDYLTITLADNNVGGAASDVGFSLSVQSSNQVDPVSMTADMIKVLQVNPSAIVPDSFVLSDLGGGLAQGRHAVAVASGIVGEDPPLQVLVSSSSQGSVASKVSVSALETSGGLVDTLRANAGRDFNILNGGINVTLSGGSSTGPGVLSYVWTHDALASDGVVVTGTTNPSEVVVTSPMTLQASRNGKLVVTFTLTVTDPGNPSLLSSTATAIVTITEPAALPVDDCPITKAFYDENKEKWKVEGGCDLSKNQNIKVYAGDVAGPNLAVFIGEFWVELGGLWSVAPGNNSAPLGTLLAGGDGNGNKTYSHVWAISSRGSVTSRIYIIK